MKNHWKTTHRSLAYKWTRIAFRCWKNKTPYDKSKYLEALKLKGSPLLEFAVKNKKRLVVHLRACCYVFEVPYITFLYINQPPVMPAPHKVEMTIINIAIEIMPALSSIFKRKPVAIDKLTAMQLKTLFLNLYFFGTSIFTIFKIKNTGEQAIKSKARISSVDVTCSVKFYFHLYIS